MRVDIIEVYKIMHGVGKMDKEKLFSSQNTKAKCYPMAMNPERSGTEKRFLYI